MKKIILAGVLAVAFLPAMASASNWRTIGGHINFANSNDVLVVELDGVQIFSVSPQTRLVSVNGGEWSRLDIDKSVNWVLDLNVSEVNVVEKYVISNGVKTLVK